MLIDSFYKKFAELFERFFGFKSNFAKSFENEARLSNVVWLIFTFLLLLLVFSFNSL